MPLRPLLVLGLLGLFAAQTPAPWGGLWLMVPGAVALSLLAAWRFGAWGVLLPLVMFTAAMVFVGPFSVWVWWIPIAALIGVWMGLREEGPGPAAGERAWMLLPALLLAAGLPWAIQYPDLIAAVRRELHAGDTQLLDLGRQMGYQAAKLADLQRSLDEQAKLRDRILPHVMPTVLFVWVALLVAARSRTGRRCPS